MSSSRARACPLCRSDVVSGTPPATSVQIEPTSDATPLQRLGALREQLEREDAERREAHQRRLALESRMANYQSSIWTPSGRPYESLPVTTLAEMKTMLRSNMQVTWAGTSALY